MKELMEALTRAANAVAMHYEGTGGTFAAPAPVEKPLSEDVPAARKARAKKEPAADIGLDTPGSSEKKIEGMTEADAIKGVTDVAKLLVSKFSKPVAPDNKPEGFHIAKKLLIDTYKVGRLSDLSHEQRVDFIRAVKEILTKESAAAGTVG